MNMSQLLRQRLRRDLYEIQANADRGFSIHPCSHDMRRLCLHICPESGPLAYLRLHFSIELPSSWVSRSFCGHISFRHGRGANNHPASMYRILCIICFVWRTFDSIGVDVDPKLTSSLFSSFPTSRPRLHVSGVL
jgi:hypothetical protein